MKIYRWNGEYWYHDKRNFLKRARQWIIWIGGWEKANGTGWNFMLQYGKKRKIKSATPVSLFGHRITFYGRWLNIRLGRGWLVYSRNPHDSPGCYITKDGTPGGAFVWYSKAPYKIVREAEKREI